MSINQPVDKCPPYFMIGLHFQENLHRYQTGWSVDDHLNIPTFQTQKYGYFSVRASVMFMELYAKFVNKKFITQNLKFKTSSTNSNIVGLAYMEACI